MIKKIKARKTTQPKSKNVAFQLMVDPKTKADFKALCATKHWHLYERIEELMQADINNNK